MRSMYTSYGFPKMSHTYPPNVLSMIVSGPRACVFAPSHVLFNCLTHLVKCIFLCLRRPKGYVQTLLAASVPRLYDRLSNCQDQENYTAEETVQPSDETGHSIGAVVCLSRYPLLLCFTLKQ